VGVSIEHSVHSFGMMSNPAAVTSARSRVRVPSAAPG
jgi:hypothetical protein